MESVLDYCSEKAGYFGVLVALFLGLNTVSVALSWVAARTETKRDDKWAARLLSTVKFLRAIVDFLIAKR